MIGVEGEEIGDECVFITAPVGSPPPIYGDPSAFTIGRHLYAVQLEYSNAHLGVRERLWETRAECNPEPTPTHA